MILSENYFEARREAIKWLNVPSHKRNFSQGLLILQKSGYKPQVAALLVRKGEKDWTREKLMYCLRELLQVYYNPDDERFKDDDVDVLNEQAGESNIREQKVDITDVEKEGPDYKKWPEPIRQLMKVYAKTFKERALTAKQRAALGDTNDTKVTAQRKQLSEKMETLTAHLEGFWKLRERYDREGLAPTQEEIKAVIEGDKEEEKEKKPEKETDDDYSNMPLDELATKRKSAVTQRTRKENLLKYQLPSKGKVPNPMPDCPKRIKLERQIEKLTVAISKMDYELAKRS